MLRLQSILQAQNKYNVITTGIGMTIMVVSIQIMLQLIMVLNGYVRDISPGSATINVKNASVASVDQAGCVTGIGVGKTKVWVKTNKGGFQD